MIVGNGLVASAFSPKYNNNQQFVIFASGVSNSKETNIKEYQREIDLILKTLEEHTEKTFVYFSTTSLYTAVNTYTTHKKYVENYLKTYAKRFFVFRLPQVVGMKGNPNNLINFFVNKIDDGESIRVAKNINRSLIDVEDVYKIVDNIINNSEPNQMLDIANVELKKVSEIVSILENVLEKTATTTTTDFETDCYSTNSKLVEECIEKLGIRHCNYTHSILQKYVKYYRRNSQRPIL